MNDIFDSLRSGASAQPPAEPPSGARERAMAEALEAFDEHFAAEHQAFTHTEHPKDDAHEGSAIPFRSSAMSVQRHLTSAGRYGLAASLAAVVSAVTLFGLSNTPTRPDADGGPGTEYVRLSPAPVAGDGLTYGAEGSAPALALAAAIDEAAVVSGGRRSASWAGDPRSSGDRFPEAPDNAVHDTRTAPVSTFSVDVDTASYALARRLLNEGQLPPADAVRTEEMVNYFAYDYEAPTSPEAPFNADIALMPAPWYAQAQLLRIGLQGYTPPDAARPPVNLVFLVDTSGSMGSPDRLPLLQSSLRLLLEELGPRDSIGIVAYAGSAGVVLEPTAAHEHAKISHALERLAAGGSTAGAAGIEQAYALATANYDADKVNRVILATDGDFNVGVSSTQALKAFIEEKRESGVYLSVLGFGRGNLNDELMQALAQNGNGQAAYIDSLDEARKVLVEQASGTLVTIAKDVKIQVEFNPDEVAEYRLLGYETRALSRADFNNDRVDAGDIGSGHQVTALYELILAADAGRRLDPLRYAPAPTPTGAPGLSEELAFVKVRYKAPDGTESRLLSFPVTRANAVVPDTPAAQEFAFAAAVAAFGQKLRADPLLADFAFEEVIDLARANRGADRFGYRGEFVRMAQLAHGLSQR